MATRNNNKDDAKIAGTSSADKIQNNGGNNVSISAGAGNDSITVQGGHNVTVSGGKGNDYLFREWGVGVVYVYTSGNDTIQGFHEATALVIADSWTSVRTDDSTVKITVKNKGTITLTEYYPWEGNTTIVSSLAKAKHYNLNWNDNNKTFKGTNGNDYMGNGGNKVKLNALAGDDFIENNGSNVTIDAGDGNDFVGNWEGSRNLIKLGAGNDIFQNGGDYATIDGGAGNDSIRLWGENTTNISVNSGAGDDYIHANAKNSTIFTGAGNDFIQNGAENVSINGGAGNDTIESYGNNATVAGGAGNDLINGGVGLVYVYSGGNDTLQNFLKSSTLVLGKNSINSSVYNGENGDVTLNISNGGKIILQSYWEDIINTVSSASKATHFNVIRNNKSKKTVTGTNGADFIENMNWNEDYQSVTINSGAGNDHIQTNGSKAFVNAGKGNDIVENWGNKVTINGGDGNDFITNYHEGEKVSINSGNGNDTIYNYSSNVTIAGGAGSEFFWNSYDSEKVLMSGGADNDILINEGSYNSIAGNDGDDYFWNNSGHNNSINGGAGNDEIDGYHFSNSISGGASNDFIKVNAGNSNIINGGAGKDTITINAGWKMTVDGGTGNDSLSLNSTSTLIKYKSGDGNDTIRGFNSTDTLSITGGTYSTQFNGNDVLIKVGKGTITLKDAKGNAININGKNVGGKSTNAKFIPLTSGNDTITNNQNNVTISGLGGNDFLENDFGDKVSISGGAGNDSIISFHEQIWNEETNSPEIVSYPEKITINGGKGNDLIDFNAGAKNSLIQYASGDGNDTIYGFDSDDTLNISGSSYSTKKSGSDIIVTVGTGKITLSGAASLSKVNIKGAKSDASGIEFNSDATSATLNNKYGNDSFELSNYPYLETIDASAVKHSLKIIGNKNANKITATSEDDSIYGGAGGDTILGGAGNDKLYGEKGNDSLVGGKGDDSLWGSEGSDTLTGGTGKDIFFYDAGDGNDVITDYSPSLDTVIILSSVLIGNPTADKSGDVIFKIGTGQITFQNSSGKYIELVDKVGNILKKHNPS